MVRQQRGGLGRQSGKEVRRHGQEVSRCGDSVEGGSGLKSRSRPREEFIP
jgi:hypothetical protein